VDAARLRLAPAAVAEEHSLDPPSHDHSPPDRHDARLAGRCLYDGRVDTVAEHLTIDEGILVGHDGSAHAEAALRCGVSLAKRFGRPLHVVRTWAMSSAPRPESWEPGYVPPLGDYETAVLKALTRDVEAAGLTPGENVEVHVVHGAPARRLVESSGGADLLVVARRGRGGFAGLGLGSVTDQVIRHASCPVVVVPAKGVKDDLVEADSGVA
jgi:nucleotide-binding universal stress UspA family protein